MRKIGFIGAHDKTDFILYIARVLTGIGQKVLFIDATVTQKARYVVPNIQNTKSYVTEFEGIDVAVGFKSFEEIRQYFQMSNMEKLQYDIILIDTNSAGGVLSYKINECEKIYFVTSMDMYSIRKGIESLSVIKEKLNVTKVLFSTRMSKEEDDYINYLSAESNIEWAEDIISLPFEQGDETTIFKHQRAAKISLKGLTSHYRDGLLYITTQIAGDEKYKDVNKELKKMERGI